MDKAKIAKLKKTVQAGYKARNELDDLESRNKDKQNKKLIGKCYRYRNSYSSGDSWWLYAKITGVKDGWLNGWKFEKTTADRIEIWDTTIHRVDEYQEITKEEFNQAWNELLNELNSMNS